MSAYAVWGDSVDIVARVATPATSITVPAMKGSYLIKAVDHKGNESLNATIAVASIIRIPGFTNAQTISQPTWDGQGYTTEYNDEYEGIVLSVAPIGDNLVTNGADFTGDPTPTGWEPVYCTIESVAGGQEDNCLELTRVSDIQQYVYWLVTLVIGKSYRFSAWVKSGTAGDYAYVMGAKNAAYTYVYGIISGTSSSSWVLRTFDFVATEEASLVYLLKNGTGAGSILFDTVELYELGLSPTGSYILSDTVDLEGIYTARISASLGNKCY